MSSITNTYATKVFSEHPVALWPLDENVDYISLIPVSDQDMSLWTTSDTVVDAADFETFGKTIPSLIYSDIPANGIFVSGGTSELISNISIAEEDISYDLGSIAIGFYICTFDKDVTVTFGYQYFDGSVTQYQTRELILTQSNSWGFVSNTFDLPDPGFSDLEIYIRVDYTVTDDPYGYAIHSITVGQESENYYMSSLGQQKTTLPSDIDINADCIVANTYGLQQSEGFYIIKDNVLKARNTGIPLVYGTDNSTVLIPNDGEPSLVIPGLGFLNDYKKYQDFTLEFWARIQSNSVMSRRIVGPISSDDGIYVDGPFIKLKIDGFVGTHYVGEWDRPMLIQIRMTRSDSSLVINGETVITLDTDVSTISLPDEYSGSFTNDLICFYAYDDVPQVEVDCIGIYPYVSPNIVAKRRFAFGQAVAVPDNLKGLNNASSVFVDYPFAEYAKNYSYPNVGKWQNGTLENLTANSQTLSIPEYDLPRFRFNNKTSLEWDTAINDAQDSEDPFISLKPNSDWDDTNGHILFKNINFLKEETKAIYGIFELLEEASEEQTLFELHNDIYGRSIIATILGSVVSYKLRYKKASGEIQEDLLYSSVGIGIGDRFMAGIDIDRFSAFYGKNASSFFGNKHQTKAYFGGNKEFTNTFPGKIHRIAFCNKKNFNVISPLFTFFGLPAEYENVFELYLPTVDYDAGADYFGTDENYWALVLDGGDPYPFEEEAVLVNKNTHTATYTLVGKIDLGTFLVDIDTDSSWQDYVPLTYFGKYVKDDNNRSYFSLDFLQFNIDYPKMSIFNGTEYDTSDSIVKTYVSFQYLNSGVAKNSLSYISTKSLDKNSVVDPGSDWLTTKYEVLNDTIIYPPGGVDFKKLAIVIHIDMLIPGINKYPVKIRSMQLASKAVGSSATKIGTKFGKAVYPYKKSGQYFNYKAKNPFSIYKGSTPHLYLTGNSGLKLRTEYSRDSEYGISIPINKNRVDFFHISSMQMAFRYDEEFTDIPMKVFELQTRARRLALLMAKDPLNSNRAQLYLADLETGLLETNLEYYLNGRLVKRPYIYRNEWVFLGLTFTPSLSFDAYFGAMRVTSPILFNNVSFYQVPSERQLTEFQYRTWSSVVYDSVAQVDLQWNDWESFYLWREVLYLGEVEGSNRFNAGDIFKIYTGTNTTVFGGDEIFRFGDYQTNIYKDIRWNSRIVTAV